MSRRSRESLPWLLFELALIAAGAFVLILFTYH
jgi:hypothetical protein